MIAHHSWIVAAISTICGLIILRVLSQSQFSTPSAPVIEDTVSVT